MHGCICLITPYSYINIYTFFFAEIFDNKFPTSCSLVSKCINIYILRIRTFSTVFLIECTILLSCQPCMGAPVTIFGKSCFSQSVKPALPVSAIVQADFLFPLALHQELGVTPGFLPLTAPLTPFLAHCAAKSSLRNP